MVSMSVSLSLTHLRLTLHMQDVSPSFLTSLVWLFALLICFYCYGNFFHDFCFLYDRCECVNGRAWHHDTFLVHLLVGPLMPCWHQLFHPFLEDSRRVGASYVFPYMVQVQRTCPLPMWARWVERFHNKLNGNMFDLERDGLRQVVPRPWLTMCWKQTAIPY